MEFDKQLRIQMWFKTDVYHFQGTKHFQIVFFPKLTEHTFTSKHHQSNKNRSQRFLVFFNKLIINHCLSNQGQSLSQFTSFNLSCYLMFCISLEICVSWHWPSLESLYSFMPSTEFRSLSSFPWTFEQAVNDLIGPNTLYLFISCILSSQLQEEVFQSFCFKNLHDSKLPQNEVQTLSHTFSPACFSCLIACHTHIPIGLLICYTFLYSQNLPSTSQFLFIFAKAVPSLLNIIPFLHS